MKLKIVIALDPLADITIYIGYEYGNIELEEVYVYLGKMGFAKLAELS